MGACQMPANSVVSKSLKKLLQMEVGFLPGRMENRLQRLRLKIVNNNKKA